MTWTFGATGTTATGNNGTSLTPGLPASWAPGDLCVLSCQNFGGAGARTPSAPAGWTPFNGTTGYFDDGAGAHHGVWYRVMQDGDTDPTITYSGAGVAGDSQLAKVSRYIPDPGHVPMFRVAGSGSINASADNIGPIAGIAVEDGDLVVCSAGKTNDISGTYTVSAPWTHSTGYETTTGNDASGTLERILSATAGTLSDLTITDNGGTASNGVGFGVMLAFYEVMDPLYFQKKDRPPANRTNRQYTRRVG